MKYFSVKDISYFIYLFQSNFKLPHGLVVVTSVYESKDREFKFHSKHGEEKCNLNSRPLSLQTDIMTTRPQGSEFGPQKVINVTNNFYRKNLKSLGLKVLFFQLHIPFETLCLVKLKAC